MILCPICGTLVNQDTNVCEYCGHELKNTLMVINTVEKNLHALEKALSAVQQIEAVRKAAEFAKSRQEIEEGRQEILDNDMPPALVIISLPAIIVAGGIGASSNGVLGMLVAAIMALIVLGLIYQVYSSLTKASREEKADFYYNSSMEDLENLEKKAQASAEALKKKPNIAGALIFLPEKYHDSEIISYLIELFLEKRVDNLKEALNLYENDMHNQRMEEMLLDEIDSRQQCPSCGGRNCTLMTETTTKKGGYSASDGCCGYILFGPIGLLCGACGSGEETTTKTYWMCQNCGNKFNA